MALNISGMPGLGAAGGVQGLDAGAAAKPASLEKSGDVNRFENAMESLANKQAETPSPEQALQANAEQLRQPLSVGDRILQGITSVSDNIQAGRAQAVGVLDKENISQTDVLRAQQAMNETSTMVSLIGKATSSITQGVKTMQQG